LLSDLKNFSLKARKLV